MALTGAAGACQRVPEEPPPPTTVVASPTASAPSPPMAAAGASAAPPPPSSRCILATPKTAPPPASAAPAGACPPDPDRAPPKLPVVALSFPDSVGASLHVELARTEDEAARGLMYRRAMPADRGMLFRMRDRKEQRFWMHDTCIPLDMVFVDDDGFIVGLLENVPTLNDAERTVGCASSWVLETNAGWTRRHGVVAGQRVAIPAEARRP